MRDAARDKMIQRERKREKQIEGEEQDNMASSMAKKANKEKETYLERQARLDLVDELTILAFLAENVHPDGVVGGTQAT